jgi:putative NADH-flavin reductase
MKKIALFGATGQTGKEFLKQALQAGYEVRALARKPAKVEQRSEQLMVIKGDVLNQTDVDKTVKGTDLVVSLFGHVKGSPEWLQTNGTKNIIDAMRKNGVTRIVSLSGGGLPFPEKDEPKFPDKLIRFIMKIAVPKVLNDAVKHAEVLRSSGLDWEIVRGPRLTNDAPKGTYREGWVGVNASTKIARADLATFLVRNLESNKYKHQMPFISY